MSGISSKHLNLTVALLLVCWFAAPANAQGPFGLLSPFYSTSPEWTASPKRQLSAVAYGHETFVGVGEWMTILVSKDGKNWINRSSQISNPVANVNFTTDTYTAGGDILTVAVSDHWPSETELLRGPFRLSAVCFGNGVFTAVGDCGTVISSRNGDDWTTCDCPTPVRLNGIAWGISNFVAVGEQGTILTSQNGVRWTQQRSDTKEALFGVAYGNGTFLAVGDNSTILSSADGTEWTPQKIELLAPIGYVAFGNGIFLIAGNYGYGLTLASKDAKTWQEVDTPGDLRSLAFGDGKFIAGAMGSSPCFSTNGKNWDPPFPKRRPQLGFGVSCANGIFISTDDALAVSTNGVDWQPVECPASRLVQGNVRWDERLKLNIFVAQVEDFQKIDRGHGGRLGYYPLQLLSRDENTWTTPDGVSVSGNVCGHKLLYRTNGSPVVLSSGDGIKWTRLRP